MQEDKIMHRHPPFHKIKLFVISCFHFPPAALHVLSKSFKSCGGKEKQRHHLYSAGNWLMVLRQVCVRSNEQQGSLWFNFVHVLVCVLRVLSRSGWSSSRMLTETLAPDRSISSPVRVSPILCLKSAPRSLCHAVPRCHLKQSRWFWRVTVELQRGLFFCEHWVLMFWGGACVSLTSGPLEQKQTFKISFYLFLRSAVKLKMGFDQMWQWSVKAVGYGTFCVFKQFLLVVLATLSFI